MSHEEESKNEWLTPERERDKLPNRRLVGIAAVTLAVFTLFGVIAWFQLRARQQQLNPRGAAVPEELGQAEINILNQSVMELDTRAYEQRERQRQRLQSYGWVDRERGLVHIPIHEAIRQVVEEERVRRGEERR